MKLGRRFRWAIVFLVLFISVLACPILFVKVPNRLTPEDVLCLNQLAFESGQKSPGPMSRRDIEML